MPSFLTYHMNLLHKFQKLSVLFVLHYANMPKQCTAIFHGCNNVNFQMKKSFNIFLIFAQNIDCVYTLEPPQ